MAILYTIRTPRIFPSGYYGYPYMPYVEYPAKDTRYFAASGKKNAISDVDLKKFIDNNKTEVANKLVEFGLLCSCIASDATSDDLLAIIKRSSDNKPLSEYLKSEKFFNNTSEVEIIPDWNNPPWEGEGLEDLDSKSGYFSHYKASPYSNFSLSTAAGRARRAAKSEERKKTGKGLFRNVWKGIKRFNPLSELARAGVLVFFRFNAFGIATSMYPAFLSDADVEKRHFDKANAKKVKDHWTNKMSKFWENDLGGKAKNLEDAIKKGYDKPIFRSKKKSAELAAHKAFNGEYHNSTGTNIAAASIGGAGTIAGLALAGTSIATTNPHLAPAITAGSGAVAAMVGAMGSAGVAKNPYAIGSPEALSHQTQLDDATKAGDMTLPAVDQTKLNEVVTAGREDADAGGQDLDTILGIPRIPFIIGASAVGLTAVILIGIAVKNRQ